MRSLAALACGATIAAGTWVSESGPHSTYEEGDLIGQGVVTAALAEVGVGVDIFASIYESNAVSWTEVATLAPASPTAEFGSHVRLGGDAITRKLAFVSDSANNKMGSVYVYRGGWSEWTQVALLTPSESDQTHWDSYGETLSPDQLHHRTLVVGCAGCNISESFDSGALYVYEATSPSAEEWEETQVIRLDSDIGTRLGVGGVSLYDKTLITGAYTTVGADAPLMGHIYFKEGDSFVARQTLATVDSTDPSEDFAHFAVHDDTIIASAPDGTVSATSQAGYVNVYYPNTAKFGVPGKPKPSATWSLQQTLRSPVPTANEQFGSQIAIDGDTIYVLSNNNMTYVHTRSTISGAFTLQQTLTNDYNGQFGFVAADHSSLLVKNTIGDVEIFTNTDTWDCLIVSVEDQFGDGWGGATLKIKNPDGNFHLYAPNCDSPNPLQFRFCPQSSDDTGAYHFEIVDAKDVGFDWEIVYRVQTEANGEWYIGDVKTHMVFDFNSTMQFNAGPMAGVITDSGCEQCPDKPAPKKPSPKRRHLKGGGGTAAPTITPAPTSTPAPTPTPAPSFALIDDDSVEWQYLQMSSSGGDWYVSGFQSTSVYISDPKGKHLIRSNTNCLSGISSEQCWQVLPDGDYVMRVGGALNDDSGDHTWVFCGVSGTAQQQLTFSVSGGYCYPQSKLGLTTFCGNLDSIVHGLGYVLMGGIPSYVTYSTMSAADKSLLQKAIVSSVTGAESATIVSLEHTDDGTLFGFKLNTDAYDIGLSFNTDMNQITSTMSSDIASHTSSILTTIVQNADENSIFSSVSSLSLVDFEASSLEAIIPQFASEQQELPQKAHNEEAVSDYHILKAVETGSVDIAAVLGYLMIGALCVVAVIAVVPRLRVVVSGAVEIFKYEPAPKDAEDVAPTATPATVKTANTFPTAEVPKKPSTLQVSRASVAPASRPSRPRKVVSVPKDSVALNSSLLSDLRQMVKDVSILFIYRRRYLFVL